VIGEGGGYSFSTGLMQACGALAVVLGLIYLLSHLSRRWLRGGMRFGGRPGHIRIVETRQLAPKKALLLVEVAGEYLLLGNGSEGITLIKQIDMLEEIEVVEVLADKKRPGKALFQEKLEGIMARFQMPRLVPVSQKEQG
jgi:flagellar protein FliO/FliZ